MAREMRSRKSKETGTTIQSLEVSQNSPRPSRKRKQGGRDSVSASIETESVVQRDFVKEQNPRKRVKPDTKSEANLLDRVESSPAPKVTPIAKAISTPVPKTDISTSSAGIPASDTPDSTKKPRKNKASKELEAMPLAARTIGHRLTIGAHVSSAGGVQNAVLNSHHIGANAFALFLKSQRKWVNPALAPDQQSLFHANCKTHSYDQAAQVVPHGSYLVNLAHTDPARTTQAYESFLDDLTRCEKLGIKLYNFHPGNVEASTDPSSDPEARRAKAIAHLASNLNRAHAATTSVVTLLENMAARDSNTIGSTPADLATIIDLVHDKSRIGVCLDTCHAFASGLDLRTPETVNATLTHLDSIVGLRYLRALHLNDSKAPFDSCRDLHANIGTGFIGLRGFHALMNDKRIVGLPMVLETPIEVRDADGVVVKDEKGKVKEDKNIWAREIKLLESLVGMDADGDEFRALEEALARQGGPERKRVQEQVDKRRDNAAKKAAGGAKKGRSKRKAAETGDDDDEDEDEDEDEA